jgi:3-hydroxyisobutyrate dehydrogenase
MAGEVAFLGLGTMGFGMATNLVKHGYSVTGFDVYAPTLKRFVAAGEKLAPILREAVRGSCYIVFMVVTATQILSALFDDTTGVILELPRNAIVVLCLTGLPDYVPYIRALLDRKHDRRDVELVDALVSRGMIRAAAGTLTILASGLAALLVAVRPVLDTIAGENVYSTRAVGAGTRAKIVSGTSSDLYCHGFRGHRVYSCVRIKYQAGL